MRESESAALRALDQSGSGELPVAAASFVASGFADFSLGDCHGDTSSFTSGCSNSALMFIVQQLFQNSQSWIRIRFAVAGAEIEIHTAAGAKPFAALPAEEAAVMKLAVMVPQPQQEPGFVDNMIWFLEGLFA